MKLYVVKIIQKTTKQYILMALREDEYDGVVKEDDDAVIEIVRCIELTPGEILILQDGEYFVG